MSIWIKERGLDTITSQLMEGLDAFDDEAFAARLLQMNEALMGPDDIKHFKRFFNEELDHSLESLLARPTSHLCYDLGLSISVLHAFAKASAAA